MGMDTALLFPLNGLRPPAVSYHVSRGFVCTCPYQSHLCSCVRDRNVSWGHTRFPAGPSFTLALSGKAPAALDLRA